ncbi:hypothetical protein [Salmon gill poxvirus]|uniref:Uncharacterized protein n=1 Tax=Salmon gill poxvirus TaxID=1680908 RepID=A0A0H4YFS2_9POXV|nr:hypothetical protein AL387_gp185 [Salmon gill poxvirus]AKR04309.1 hypothetical protein SGPV185 [Salmon gill poxvirus]
MNSSFGCACVPDKCICVTDLSDIDKNKWYTEAELYKDHTCIHNKFMEVLAYVIMIGIYVVDRVQIRTWLTNAQRTYHNLPEIKFEHFSIFKLLIIIGGMTDDRYSHRTHMCYDGMMSHSDDDLYRLDNSDVDDGFMNDPLSGSDSGYDY